MASEIELMLLLMVRYGWLRCNLHRLEVGLGTARDLACESLDWTKFCRGDTDCSLTWLWSRLEAASNLGSHPIFMILGEVVIEVSLCGERLVTVFAGTMVGFLACVQTEMRLEVSFLVECLLTVLERTDKVALAFMFFQMHF